MTDFSIFANFHFLGTREVKLMHFLHIFKNLFPGGIMLVLKSFHKGNKNLKYVSTQCRSKHDY